MDFDVPIESRKELTETIDKLENLIKEGHQLLSSIKLPSSGDNMNNAPNNFVISPSKTSSAPPVVFGRDTECETLRRMLHENTGAYENGCYSVIGIHCIPVSGKTILAQYVCEKERDCGHFDLIMWIHVPKNFCVDTIFTEMLEIASFKKKDQLSSPDMLQRELEEQLKGKRFFLVLDEVWYGQGVSKQQLDLLVSPLKVGQTGSKILLTTRSADSARALGAQSLIAISDMDEEEYLSMFMRYALEGVMISDQALWKEHHSIGREIAGKLGRSPLAARTVAGHLQRNLDIDFWTRALNCDLLNDTMGVLWWTYQQLEEPLRQCFTYCSIFPRGYELERDELIHQWMAQVFVETSNGKEDMEDIGHDYFERLLSCSFIQQKGKRSDGVEYFTIHHLLHDLAERVAGTDCFRIEKDLVSEIPQDVRHLFIATYDEKVFKEQILNLKAMRTPIMSSGTKSMDAEDFRSMLKSLKKLRMVHVELPYSFSTFSPCIRELKHIRYVGLSGKICLLTLPCRFTELYHLQKLTVRRTTSVVFHHDKKLANLVNLRHKICREFSSPDTGRLTSLRTLHVFRVRRTRGHEIHELEHLDNLHGSLSIEGLENLISKEEAERAKLANKLHLSDLVLKWSPDHQSSSLMPENPDDRQSSETSRQELVEGENRDRSSESQEEVLEALRPPAQIKSLKILNYNGSTYPSWLSGEDVVLEHLQYLELSECYASALPKIGRSFMNLRKLVISGCRWYSWPENMEGLILFEHLVIKSCENILSLPTLPLTLKVLELVNWQGSILPENMEDLTSLEKLNLHTCDNILSLPRLPLSLKTLRLWRGSSLPQGIQRLTSLEVLSIRNGCNIQTLPMLPLSLKELKIGYCSSYLIDTCKTDGHPNWQKIAHVKNKLISCC